MTFWLWLALALALAVGAYLLVALLWAEDFE
jgi:K+-transporting ATPase KdpF subunit